MRSIHHELPAETSQDDLLALVESLNADAEVDGILVQLPLPEAIDQDAIVAAIDPAKDVDGLTATSAGLLARGRPRLVACTPSVMEMLAGRGSRPRALGRGSSAARSWSGARSRPCSRTPARP